jgi:purine-binding chemotaxis protein CheW
MDTERSEAPQPTLDEILAQRRLAGSAVLEVETTKVKLMLFSVGETRLALPARNLIEILPASTIHLVPGCPPAIEGVINVRGEIVSVIRLGDLIGLTHRPADRQAAILLARDASLRSGLRVDALIDLLDIPEDVIQPPPETLRASLRLVAIGLFTQGGEAVVVLDLERVFKSLTQGLSGEMQ